MSELYHHGMKGMHWGKRNGPPYPLEGEGKAALKEQRQEQKETRNKKLDPKSKAEYEMYKAYNKQRAKKAVRRDVTVAMIGGGAIGTAIGGPAGGLGSMLASGLATTAFSSAVNTGRNIVNNSKYKNMLLDSQEFKAYSEKGKQMITKAAQGKSTDRAIKGQIEQARKTGKYDMEFLERNLDLDASGNSLKGRELDAAYEKYLRNKNNK